MCPAVGNMLCCKGISHKNVARFFAYRARGVYKRSREMHVHVARTRRPLSLVQFSSERVELPEPGPITLPLQDRVFALSYQC